jgi:hypothetical protein
VRNIVCVHDFSLGRVWILRLQLPSFKFLCKYLLNEKIMYAFIFLNFVLKSGVYKCCNHDASRESAIGNNTIEQLLLWFWTWTMFIKTTTNWELKRLEKMTHKYFILSIYRWVNVFKWLGAKLSTKIRPKLWVFDRISSRGI